MRFYKMFFAVSLAILVVCVMSCSENKEHSDDTHNHAAHSTHNHDHSGHNHAGHNHAAHSTHNHDHSGHNHNHAGHNHGAEVKKADTHDTHNHSDEIEFSAAKAAHFGVESNKVKKQSFNNIIKVSGVITPAQGDLSVIVAKSSGVLKLNANAIVGKQLSVGSSIGSITSENIAGGDANEVARINYEAAKRELERITPLYHDKIVTEKDFNQVKQTFDQAKATLANSTGVGSSATSNISGTLMELYKKDGEFVEVGTPIAQVSKNSKLILKADVPVRYSSLVSNIKTANFKPAYTERVYDLAALNGKRVSNDNLTVVTPGYIPLTFEFTNKESIVPGSYAEIYLVGESIADCIALPLSAITEEQGCYFVFVKVHPESYSKKEVKLGVNNGEMVQILSGLNENEDVVTKGAIFVKLASQEGSAPGHTHDH